MSLHLRFEAIKRHYAPHLQEMCKSPDEWVIDPYAWDDPRTAMSLTPIEKALWHDIRLVDVVVYPQFPVGRYFVDFGNPAAKVAIECDGEKWHLDKEKDAARDADLKAMGWAVYRITGRDCFTDTEESEDECDRTVVTLSSARKFVLGICAAHRIRRGAVADERAAA